jgi:hypothetical protein
VGAGSGFAEYPVQPDPANGAQAFGHAAPVGYYNISSCIALLLAFHAIELTSVGFRHFISIS